MTSEASNHAAAEVCNFSDLSECFSSDLSIMEKDNNPVKRPRTDATVEDYGVTPLTPHDSPSPPQSQQQQSSSLSLLDQLIAVVEPKRNKRRDYRRITRQLRNYVLRTEGQVESYSPEKLRNELISIGEHVYGDTRGARKSRIQKWMEDGSAEYAATLKRQVRASQVGQFLQCIMARNSRKNFLTDTTQQVHESVFVYIYFSLINIVV